MKSAHVKDDLFGYLEGDLSAQEKLRVDAHLAACRTCREELAYARRIQGLMKRRTEESPGLWKGIEARILSEESPALWKGVESRILESQGIWAQLEWAGKRLAPIFAAAAIVMLALLSNLNGNDARVTLEDYLTAQWDTETLEGVAISSADLSRNDVFVLTASAAETLLKARKP